MSMRELYATLDRRVPPEDLLPFLLDLDLWSAQERQAMQAALQASRRFNPWGWSSMSTDFWRPTGLDRQLGRAAELFATPLPADIAHDPEGVRPYLGALWRELGVAQGQDFRHGRLNRAGRAGAGVEWGKRQYNKRYRLALRLERKRARLAAGLRQRTLLLASKSRLAAQLGFEDFARDAATAAFVAYYTASLNRRSVFSAVGQETALDELAALLLARCGQGRETCWWAVALVHPAPGVLACLTPYEQGELLGRTYALLTEAAGLMRELWEQSSFRRSSMVVKRGDDSSTWNLLAGAWNKLRDTWIATLWAMGAEALLEDRCLGKALRLMAADVVWLHEHHGTGGLDPNTAVWAALPLPWQVLSGEASCTRADVEAACQVAGLDPVGSGWTGPRRGARPRPFTPTLELVHGVSVGHPGLALYLRQHGVFSGKARRSPEGLT